MRTPALVRSTSKAYAGGNLTVEVDFLRRSPIAMTAPEIRTMWIRIVGLITFGGAATVTGKKLILQLINRVLMTDPTGDVISMSGASLRQWAQRCLGSAYQDPSDVVAGGAGDVAFDMYLPIPFESRRHLVPTDFHKPVSDLSGPSSQIDITLSDGTLTPSASTAVVKTANTKVEVYAEIIDSGNRCTTSRLRLRDTSVSADDFQYEVNGLLVDSWFSSGVADMIAGTKLAARNYISDGLAYLNYASTLLNIVYSEQLYSQSANDDVAAGFAQNVFASNNLQSILELPDLDKLQVRMDTAHEANSQLCICALTPRNQKQVADAVGTSVSAIGAVAGPTGQVVGESGFHTRASLPPKASAFLPVGGAPATKGT